MTAIPSGSTLIFHAFLTAGDDAELLLNFAKQARDSELYFFSAGCAAFTYFNRDEPSPTTWRELK